MHGTGASPRRAAGASPVTGAFGAEHGVGRPGDRTRRVISQRALKRSSPARPATLSGKSHPDEFYGVIPGLAKR
jgi:hypothetical protein